ncbi:hypothetical protein GMLC_39010 [Geomonas limicola]|uniref:Proline dehydrogenase n=1 Tax=Geomonas limicola TaxID=2740186 RepID=A0A6V8NCG9_9BACT|nr:hypothetical protein [Geomonas limicola]GFO70322.1 hypothetical protein GMLC_39010 [Geomonas limicola]
MLAAAKTVIYALGRLVPIQPQSVAQGAQLCRILQGHQFFTTLGRLSKAGDDPGQIVREYQAASRALKEDTPAERFYLSVKPPALRFVRDHAAAIAATALENGHGIHFDSHKFQETDATLQLLDELIGMRLPGPPGTSPWRYSLSLPTRWKRSREDARWAAQRGVRVRLVKGDFPGPADEELDPMEGCLELVDLVAGQVPELALASHDCALALDTVMHCRKTGTKVSLELFFGRPATAMLALGKDLGVPVGFYVPYGETLSVYLVRDLLANPLKLLRPDALEIFGTHQTKLARIARAL